jgi:hypothetical protein
MIFYKAKENANPVVGKAHTTFHYGLYSKIGIPFNYVHICRHIYITHVAHSSIP